MFCSKPKQRTNLTREGFRGSQSKELTLLVNVPEEAREKNKLYYSMFQRKPEKGVTLLVKVSEEARASFNLGLYKSKQELGFTLLVHVLWEARTGANAYNITTECFRGSQSWAP